MNTFRKSIATVLLGLVASAALADTTLLNASYDVARECTRTTTRCSRNTGKQKPARAWN